MGAFHESGVMRVRRVSAPWRDRFSAYYVELDGERVASVRQGAAVEVPVRPGRHLVRVTSRPRFFRSKDICFTAAGGQAVEFSCEAGGPAAAFLVALFRPHRYIRLEGPDPAPPPPPA